MAERTLAAGQKPGVLKRVLAVALLAGSIVLLAVGLRGESGSFNRRDFIAYWSAGQLLVHHGDPYSYPQILALERKQGYKEEIASTVLNPPWAMIFVVPLGYLSAYSGALIWMLAIVACIMASVRLLQRINRQEQSQDHLLAYAFAPVLACIMSAQMSGLTCLGLVLFLFWRERRPFAAGVAASVLTIKPHLFFLFFLVLLLESIRRKNFRSILGAVLGVAVAVSVPLAFDHQLLSQYLIRPRLDSIGATFIPTMSFVLRSVLRPRAFWVQFMPLAAATVWAVWYYWRNRDEWDWNRQGLLLLVVAIWAAPYSTFLDELVLLPAVVAAIYHRNPDGSVKKWTLPLFFGLNAIALALLLAQVHVMSGAYVWTTTAWLLWYCYAVRDWKTPAEFTANA